MVKGARVQPYSPGAKSFNDESDQNSHPLAKTKSNGAQHKHERELTEGEVSTMDQQELAALCLRLNRRVVESELEVEELEHRLEDVTDRGRDLLDKFTTRVRQLQRLKQQYDETKHKVQQQQGLEDDVVTLRKQVADLERALRTAKTVPSTSTSEESSDSSTVESLSIRAELLRAHNVTLEDQLRRVKQQQHEKDQTIAQLHGDLKRVQQSVAEQVIVKDEVIQKLEHTIDEYVSHCPYLVMSRVTDRAQTATTTDQ